MVLTIGLVSIALYDVIYTLRTSADPTTSIVDLTNTSATTINNPGYRESTRTGKWKNFDINYLINFLQIDDEKKTKMPILSNGLNPHKLLSGNIYDPKQEFSGSPWI